MFTGSDSDKGDMHSPRVIPFRHRDKGLYIEEGIDPFLFRWLHRVIMDRFGYIGCRGRFTRYYHLKS